jgi:hypothetical protein
MAKVAYRLDVGYQRASHRSLGEHMFIARMMQLLYYVFPEANDGDIIACQEAL